MQSQQFSHSLCRVPSSQSSFFKSQQQSVHHTKHQQRSSTSASSHFKQLQGSQQLQAKRLKEVSSESESKSQTGERLTALHSRLQQEAEKIRKWKNATEVEIKQKDKCLEEAHQKIDCQSKSLTDLQLKNESLSSRLREEVANQREIQQKIASTRDMCTALKNHAVQVDEALCKGQYDKEQLLETDRARMIQFQKLLERFQELEMNQLEWEKAQNDALNTEKNKNASLTNACEQLKEQLGQAHSKISSLKEQCADHKKSIEQLNEQIQDRTLQCDRLSQEKANLEHALCVRDSEANKLEGRLDDLHQQLTDTQSQLLDKEQLLAIAKDAIKQNEVTFDEQLAKIESNLSAERCLKEELIRAKDELATKLQTVKETLTAECDKLCTELDEAKVQLETSYQSCADLEQSLASEKSEKEAILKEKDTLSCQLVDLGEVMETMNKEIKEKEENIASIQSSLNKSKCDFEEAQFEWKKIQEQLHQQLAVLEYDKARLETQTSQLSTQLHEAQSNLELQEMSSKQGADKYKECIESLKCTQQERETEIANLKARLGSLTKNEAELTSRCSELDRLKEENKRLQESLTTQLSHSKGMQNELSDLQSQMKAKTGELSELVERYKKEASNAMQEREDAKKAYDAHVNELCSTMQRYSTENEKMVQQREKNITALKQQLEDTEKAKEASECKLDEYQRQLEQARSEVTVKSEEIKELLKAVECMQSKPSCIVPATPRRSATPLTSSTPLHSVTPVNADLNSPKYPAYSNFTTPNKLGQHPKISTTTTNILSTPAAPTNNENNSATTARVPSTPSRMYNYRVCSLPRSSNKSRPPPSTPKSINRPKKMKYQSEESEDKVLPDTMMEDDDETIFKRPKTPRVTSNVTVRKASTTSSGACTTTFSSSARQPSARKPLKNRNSRVYGKKTVGKKMSEENLSWFDTDSVFAFGPDD